VGRDAGRLEGAPVVGWLGAGGGVAPERAPDRERARPTGARALGSSGPGQIFGVPGGGLAGVTEAILRVPDLRLAFAFGDVPAPAAPRCMALPASA